MNGSGKLISLTFKVIAGIFLIMTGSYYIINGSLTWELATALVLIATGIANVALPVDINKTIINLKSKDGEKNE